MQNWYQSLPPITRFLATACFLSSLGCYVGILKPFQLALLRDYVFKQYEVRLSGVLVWSKVACGHVWRVQKGKQQGQQQSQQPEWRQNARSSTYKKAACKQHSPVLVGWLSSRWHKPAFSIACSSGFHPLAH